MNSKTVILLALVLVTGVGIGILFAGQKTNTTGGTAAMTDYSVAPTEESDTPLPVADADLNTYNGKYVTFRYPKTWKAQVKEDLFPGTIVGDSATKVRGFGEMKLFNAAGKEMLSLFALDGVGGRCSKFYVFPDSNPVDLKQYRDGQKDPTWNPQEVRLQEADAESVLLGSRLRRYGRDWYFDMDRDPKYFDAECLIPSATELNGLKLVVTERADYIVERFQLRSGTDVTPQDLKDADGVLKSFRVVSAP